MIATLTQLKSLDLTPIEEEERKAALERLPELRNSILKQQEEQHPKTLKLEIIQYLANICAQK